MISKPSHRFFYGCPARPCRTCLFLARWSKITQEPCEGRTPTWLASQTKTTLTDKLGLFMEDGTQASGANYRARSPCSGTGLALLPLPWAVAPSILSPYSNLWQKPPVGGLFRLTFQASTRETRCSFLLLDLLDLLDLVLLAPGGPARLMTIDH